MAGIAFPSFLNCPLGFPEGTRALRILGGYCTSAWKLFCSLRFEVVPGHKRGH